MRVAAVYDIHANLPALECVLSEIREEGVEHIVVGGDVFPGPFPRETLECLRSLDVPVNFVLGNGDREVLALMSGTETDWYRNTRDEWREPVRWTASQLSRDDARDIAGWLGTCRMFVPGLGEVLFCHATPRSDTEIVTRLTADDRLASVFEHHGVALIVCGHTHMQFERTLAGCRVVNAGSVGMPFGTPGADWLLLGSGVEMRHTAYDLAVAADRIRGTAYPQAEEFALRSVIAPPSEEVMLTAFAKSQGAA